MSLGAPGLQPLGQAEARGARCGPPEAWPHSLLDLSGTFAGGGHPPTNSHYSPSQAVISNRRNWIAAPGRTARAHGPGERPLLQLPPAAGAAPPQTPPQACAQPSRPLCRAGSGTGGTLQVSPHPQPQKSPETEMPCPPVRANPTPGRALAGVWRCGRGPQGPQAFPDPPAMLGARPGCCLAHSPGHVLGSWAGGAAGDWPTWGTQGCSSGFRISFQLAL